MSADYQLFAAAEMPLYPGINLVEASAGTGKTYAIAMLVLRAVVELAVPIENILIVTYTRAATEELQSRIRTRLSTARLVLEAADGTHDCGDAALHSWLARLDQPAKALQRLQLAHADIDRAAIFTIHGFCQRMLNEQALSCGQLFDMDLQTDVTMLRRQVVDDFWRQYVYPLAHLPTAFVTAEFASPEDLLKSVTAVFGEDADIEPQMPPLSVPLTAMATARDGLISWWKVYGTEFTGHCRAALGSQAFNKAFSEGGEAWLEEIAAFCGGEMLGIPQNLHWLTRTGLCAELNGHSFRGLDKKLAFLAGWPLPDEQVLALAHAGQTLCLTLRVQLAENLRDAVSIRLSQQGKIGFDELILRLAEVLRDSSREPLRQILGDRFRVALIDEFQDTDSSQWQIFSTLFGDRDHHLYLIGDPKQAIYRFRGADIHSYFAARQQAARLLTLASNYRSHPALVGEVNRLFSSRPEPFAYPEEVLAFRAVQAARTPEDGDLFAAGRSLAGMVYCQLAPCDDTGRWPSGKAAAELCRFTVQEIVGLLDRDRTTQLIEEGRGRPLAPQDIAILVRNHSQAEVYRRALAEAGVPVVVASRRSVYHTDECRELLRLLQAVVAVGDRGRLQAALSSPWFGWSGNALVTLFRDETQMSQVHDRFLEYHRMWREGGFWLMMDRLLETEQVLITLAAGSFAERRIANIYHLLELVQEKDRALGLGSTSTLQWLRQMAQREEVEGESELLLESDEEAVRIVTMHGAKGLEYAIVFCPYLWYCQDRVTGEGYQIRCREGGRALVDLGSFRFAERRQLLAQEERAEELRLLYVAVTRARLRCYVMWADVRGHGMLNDAFGSALGYLLFPDGQVDQEMQRSLFAQRAGEDGVSHLQVDAAAALNSGYRKPFPVEVLSPRLPSARSLQSDWQVTSFSALAMLGEHEDTVVAPPDRSGSLALDDLPTGAAFGNLIHALLEQVPFPAIAAGEEYRELFLQLCRRYGVQADWKAVHELLRTMVKTPLNHLQLPSTDEVFSLANIPEQQCLKEMVYSFKLGEVDTGRINTILRDEPGFTPLAWRSMRGYLTGIVDLVCTHLGKYYIVDYKTNFLGGALTDYGPEKLTAAMSEHNYGLQYWLYSLVLRRHLVNRVAGYDQRRDFGGVLYLFVRGMTPALPGNGIFACLPDPCKLDELERLLAGGRND